MKKNILYSKKHTCRKRPTSKMLVVRVSILVLLLILMTACQDKNDKTDKDANELTGSKYVSVAQVKRSDIESWLEYSGKLSAVQINDIAPQIPQKIEKIYVSEGDFVKQGTLLVSFDTNTIEQLRVNYENIKKNYERSKEL
ncbi:MAG: biotin/lipoyl-binding protein, partial [Candidatus Cloacimonetes bacterium]|nr:biotin/lipoyl-binding protein [Candidatus Cloacimonadota bacterium]